MTALLETQTAFTPLQIELTKEVTQWNLAPLASCIILMLPPGLAAAG